MNAPTALMRFPGTRSKIMVWLLIASVLFFFGGHIVPSAASEEGSNNQSVVAPTTENSGGQQDGSTGSGGQQGASGSNEQTGGSTSSGGQQSGSGGSGTSQSGASGSGQTPLGGSSAQGSSAQTTLTYSPTIWTDKADYPPTEPVTILGKGFEPGIVVTLKITRPDGIVHNKTAAIDSQGNLSYLYTELKIEGTYKVEAIDASGNVVAATTFDDSYVASIWVDKTASPTTAKPGDTITYTYKVKNTGDYTLYEVSLTDNKLGSITLPSSATILSPNEQVTVTATYGPVKESDLPGPTINTAEAKGKTSSGVWKNDTDNATVNLTYDHEINVTKTADKSTAKVGDTITYTYTVKNTGDVTLYDASLTDDELGSITLPPSASELSPDEEVTVTATYTVQGSDLPGPITNIAEAKGKYWSYAYQIWKWEDDDDNVSVTLLYAKLRVTKKANGYDTKLTIHQDKEITYTIKVENTGNETVTAISLSDDKYQDIVASLPGQPFLLKKGYSKTFTYKVTAKEDVTNTATATGQDPDGNSVSASDDVFVDVLVPGLIVTKTASPKVIHSGGTVSYTIKVENTGEIEIEDIHLSDDKYPLATTHPYHDHFNLDPGHSQTFPGYQTKVYGSGQVCNTVTATGKWYGCDPTEIKASDKECVTVINPAIEVTKTASPDKIHSGDEVTYTATVDNTGDDPLTNVSLNDDQGLTFTLKSGDTNSNSILDTDEIWTYEAKANLTSDTTNKLTVTAKNSLNEDVTDDDTASVDVIDPKIEVTKTASPDKIYSGDKVTYTATVDNTGDDPITNLNLNDDKGLSFSYVSGDTNNDNILDTNEIWTYQATAYPTADVTNKLTITGKDSLNADVTDNDTASVDVINPSIEVTKEADVSGPIYSGTMVDFTVTVDNTGDDPITNVVVNDNTGISFTLTSGDTDNDNVLDTDETWIYQASKLISSDHTNEATVTGKDSLNGDVTDKDDASVDVINPGLEVTKKASSDMIYPGDEVTYTATVDNTGDDPITNLTLVDDQGLIFTYVSGDTDNDNSLDTDEIWTYQATAYPTTDVTNKLTVTGKDSLQEDVSGSASASVVVLPFGSIGDTIFNDANDNSVQDPGELGIAGVTVVLLKDDGVTVVDTQTTNPNGSYLFGNLEMGGYIVKVTDDFHILDGYNLTSGKNPTDIILLDVGVKKDYLNADFGYYLSFLPYSPPINLPTAPSGGEKEGLPFLPYTGAAIWLGALLVLALLGSGLVLIRLGKES